MARSDRALLVVLFLALPIACAQVTGLSDDYRFDRGANEGGADGATDGSDAGSLLEGGVCSAADQTAARTQVLDANGEKVPPACRACLFGNCCSAVSTCSGNNTCKSAMSCIFGCQDKTQQNEKRACLQGCDESTFNASLGACAQQQCQATCDLR